MIGTSGNAKLSIDEYIGHNLENKDETTTKGASLSLSPSKTVISGVGINYANKDLESVTKNTVIGNVEIGKSSGDEINKDLSTMTEVTKDEDTKTNVFVESQTIKYAVNPEAFKQDLEKAKKKIHDIYHAVESTVNPQGKESRNVLQQLGEVRQAKTIYNVIGSRLDIAENQEDIAKAFEGVSEDLGYKVKVIYTDPSKSPQLTYIDKNGKVQIKNGTAYVDKDTGIGYILINSNSSANSTKAGVIETIAEEQSHIIGKIEGRQKTVPDGSEKGLESLGRPTNDYFKNQYSKNDKTIGIVSDGKDYPNVDFGEHVGDSPLILAAVISGVIGGASSYKYYKNTEAIIDTGIENVKNKENVEKYIKIFKTKGKLAMLDEMAKEFKNASFSNFSNKLFAIYGATDEIRKIYLKKELDKESNKMVDTLVLDKFFPEETKRLWKSDKTFENLHKVTYFWYDKANQFGEYKIDYDNRERSTRAHPDFTWSIKNSEFYALGTTLLFQSTYGSVKKTKYDKYVEYDVDIKVIFQYKDKFEGAKNINPFQNATQNRGMEFEGGAPFNFRTELREVSVKGKFTNIKNIETEIKKNMLKQLEEE